MKTIQTLPGRICRPLKVARTAGKLALYLGLAIGLIPVTGYAQQSLVSVDPVVEQEFTQTVPILGRLVARQAGTVATRIAGPVEEILVQVGDRVTRGQLLAVLDSESPRLQKQLAEVQRAEAESRITTANAELELAMQEVKRLSGLKSSASVSKAQMEDAIQQRNIAIARVGEAEAAVKSSESSIQLADLEVRHANILAPYNGTVTAKLTEVGSYIQPGSGVVQMVSDSLMELEADIPRERLAGLTRGREIDVTFDDDRKFTARVRAVVPEENPRTRTRRVRFHIDLDPRQQDLAVAQSAVLHVPAGASRQVISVHKDGIIRSSKGTIVYVVDQDIAKLRPIHTGESVGNRMEVLDGLTAGERVVIRGNERLQPDQPVTVANGT